MSLLHYLPQSPLTFRGVPTHALCTLCTVSGYSQQKQPPDNHGSRFHCRLQRFIIDNWFNWSTIGLLITDLQFFWQVHLLAYALNTNTGECYCWPWELAMFPSYPINNWRWPVTDITSGCITQDGQWSTKGCTASTSIPAMTELLEVHITQQQMHSNNAQIV